MAKIKLTDTMAEAMLTEARSNGRELGEICWGSMRHSTCNGLVARGLIESRRVRNGDRPGYAGRYPDVKNWHAFLTPAGRIVQESLRADAGRRTWSEEELDSAEDVDAGRLTLEEALDEFEQDWLLDFRGHAVRVQFRETDRDAGRLTLEEALEEAQTAGLTGELSVVRIGYADGTKEEIRNIPRGEIAVAMYAEAVDNDRVTSAELVRGDGTVAASYPREPKCGRILDPGACLWETITRDISCAREPGHRHHPPRHVQVG